MIFCGCNCWCCDFNIIRLTSVVEECSTTRACVLVTSSSCSGCFGGGSLVKLVVFCFFGWGFIIFRKFVHGVRVLLNCRVSDTIGLLVLIAQDLTTFPSLFNAIGDCFEDEW